MNRNIAEMAREQGKSLRAPGKHGPFRKMTCLELTTKGRAQRCDKRRVQLIDISYFFEVFRMKPGYFDGNTNSQAGRREAPVDTSNMNDNQCVHEF